MKRTKKKNSLGGGAEQMGCEEGSRKNHPPPRCGTDRGQEKWRESNALRETFRPPGDEGQCQIAQSRKKKQPKKKEGRVGKREMDLGKKDWRRGTRRCRAAHRELQGGEKRGRRVKTKAATATAFLGPIGDVKNRCRPAPKAKRRPLGVFRSRTRRGGKREKPSLLGKGAEKFGRRSPTRINLGDGRGAGNGEGSQIRVKEFK